MTYEEIVERFTKLLDGNKLTKNNIIPDKMETFAVQVDITGEGHGAFYIAYKNGAIEVAPYEYYGYDAKIIADSSVLIKIADGKKFVAALDEGEYRIEGGSKYAECLDYIKRTRPAKKRAKKAGKAQLTLSPGTGE